MRLPIRWLTAGWAALAALSACTSGQTGSPDCAKYYSCVCQAVGGIAFRGKVTALHPHAQRVTLRVIEVLSAYDDSRVYSDALLEGHYRVGPCGAESAVVVGDEVFASSSYAGAEIWLLPWSEPLEVQGQSVDVQTLTDRYACARVFPDPQQRNEECHDTRSVQSCALSGRTSRPHVAVVALGVCAALWVRRRRRSRGDNAALRA